MAHPMDWSRKHYRVWLKETGGVGVELLNGPYIGHPNKTIAAKKNDELCGSYDNIKELPVWMQERLAVLSVLPTDEVSNIDSQDILGVGSRCSQEQYSIGSYWVQEPDEEES